MSSQTAHDEVQKAWYDLLAPNDVIEPGLAALGLAGVYDFRGVPQNAVFPYVTLGDAYELPYNSLGRRGYRITMTNHIWSRERGTEEASNILARMNTLIDQIALNLSSQTHVYTMYDRGWWLADPDGLTMHIAARYVVFTQE